MKKYVEQLFYAIYKMPPAPHPPFGDPDSVRVFRASSKLYYTNLLNWFVKQFFAALAFFYFIIWTRINIFESYLPPEVIEVVDEISPFSRVFNIFYDIFFSIMGSFIPFIPSDDLFLLFQGLAMLSFIVQLPFSYAAVLIDYKMRWYIVTDRSLRIREGVTRVRELTMTYANIQNISIQRNILQQFLGIADLKVQTAGGAGGEDSDDSNKKSIHVAYFKGVENAEEMRDLILSRLNQIETLPSPEPEKKPETTPPLIQAVNQLLTEAETLREVMKG